tara:strand:- start:1183 stop:1866 length:684 start_codon:yes stop_codon:yes gene_type:complete
MPIQPAFSIPIYYNKPTDDEYELIQEELLEVHKNTDYELPLQFPKNSSHLLTPKAFSANIIKKYNCDYFLEFLKKSVKDYLGSLQYTTPMEYIIDSSWITKTTKGRSAVQHTHGSTDVSGVYYIKTNGQDGNLCFEDPNQVLVSNLIMDLVVDQNVAPLEQGLIILWPGYLSHRTFVNETDHERLSLSFNIKFARRGFTIKDNVEDTRGLVVRDDTWKDTICFEDLN